jgi:hypothetical protein
VTRPFLILWYSTLLFYLGFQLAGRARGALADREIARRTVAS